MKVAIPPADYIERETLFTVYIHNNKVATDVSAAVLARHTVGLGIVHIEAICKEAAVVAAERTVTDGGRSESEITCDDFYAAIDTITLGPAAGKCPAKRRLYWSEKP